MNQPTVTGVVLFHKEVGCPWYRGFAVNINKHNRMPFVTIKTFVYSTPTATMWKLQLTHIMEVEIGMHNAQQSMEGDISSVA
jgi:hypothetical protein